MRIKIIFSNEIDRTEGTVTSMSETVGKSEKKFRFARGRAKRKVFARKAILNDNLIDCGDSNSHSEGKAKKVAKSAKILSTNNKRKRMQNRKKGLHDLNHARALHGALSAHISSMRPKELYAFFRTTLKQPSAANSDPTRGLLLKRTPYKFCLSLTLRMQRLLLANLFVNNSLLSLAKRILDSSANGEEEVLKGGKTKKMLK